MSDEKSFNFEDLPKEVREGLSDLSYDLRAVVTCRKNPDVFVDAEWTIDDRLGAMQEILDNLLD
jgi:hypothetical protein